MSSVTPVLNGIPVLQWIPAPQPEEALPPAPQYSENEMFCGNFTQADVDAQWADALARDKARQIMEYKVGMSWVNPSDKGGCRTKDSQRCMDYFNASLESIASVDALIATWASDTLALSWDDMLRGAARLGPATISAAGSAPQPIIPINLLERTELVGGDLPDVLRKALPLAGAGLDEVRSKASTGSVTWVNYWARVLDGLPSAGDLWGAMCREANAALPAAIRPLATGFLTLKGIPEDLPFISQGIGLRKMKTEVADEHFRLVYGMLRDYDAGKILLPLDDLDARARESLADVKRVDPTDPGSYQYPVDAYAMKYLGRNSYAEAQFQAMRAQLVVAGGYYLPENALVDGPDLIFKREDVVLSDAELLQVTRAEESIQARYAKIAKVLTEWDYEKLPRLPTEQEWAAAGVPKPGTAVSDILLNQYLEESAKTREEVNAAGADARDVITKNFQDRMTALAQTTLAQVQAIEGTVSIDRVAYDQAKVQILGEAQAQIDAAKGRLLAARDKALTALVTKAKKLEKLAPPRSMTKLVRCKELLDQAATATVPEGIYPPLAQVADLLDLVSADIEAAAADERRRQEDAQLLVGARELLNKALIQASEGLMAMTRNAALAAQVAAEEARQAHLQAQRDTQAAVDALARLQGQAATFRLAAVPVTDGAISSVSAGAAADALAKLQAAQLTLNTVTTATTTVSTAAAADALAKLQAAQLKDQQVTVLNPAPTTVQVPRTAMPSTAELQTQIAAARSAAGVPANPSTLQMIAMRTKAEELEEQVPGAMQALQAAYDAEIAAARAVNQARIAAAQAADKAGLSAASGVAAKDAAGLSGKEIGIGAGALIAAKVLLLH